MRNSIFWQFSIAIPLAVAGVTPTTSGNHVLAQLTPDNSLGTESSIVTPQQLRDLIQGGAIRDSALFHSFDEFNVGDGRSVFFDLQNNTDILNIFTRVTGGNVSNILGTLGVLNDALNSDVLGNANLFLLNPNGITFGANANLQLNGSFFATTADGFGFDNFTFSASGEEVPPPLLTISIPRSINFRDNPGNIAVNQGNLTVNQGQNLSLVGGNVTVTGSGDINNLQGSLTAAGGRIELGGLTVAETVNINPDFSLVFPDGVARGDVSLTDAATLSVVSDTIGFNGGSVALTGQNLFIANDSAILAGIGAGFGGDGVTAGDIDLNATDAVTINNSFSENTLPPGSLTQGRGVQNRLNEGATGTGGDVNVTADSLSINNGGFISISTFGFGNAGDIDVNVAGELAIDGENETSFSRLSNVVAETAVGDGGDIIINADSVSLTNASTINTNVFAPTFDEDGVQTAPGGVGNGGDVQITTNTFTMNSEADINTGTSGVGNAGNVFINATGNVTIDGEIGERFFTQIVSNVGAGGEGDAGSITINAASFNLLNSARLLTSVSGETEDGTPGGIGNAGNITVDVTEDVTISGSVTVNDGRVLFSSIFNNVESGAVGNAGNTTISAGGTITMDDAFISSSILAGAEGDAGDITINANSLNVLNNTLIQTAIIGQANDGTPGGIGDAGNVLIDVTGDVNVSASNISSDVFAGATGNAGNITISADSIFIESVGETFSSLDVRNFTNGTAGAITLNANGTISINSSFVRAGGRLGSISIGDDENFRPRQVTIDGGSFVSTNNSIPIATEFVDETFNIGGVSIQAVEEISISNNSNVDSSSFRLGNAGNVTIQANSVDVNTGASITSNVVAPAFDPVTGLQSILGGNGNAGNVQVTTNSLEINSGGSITSSTSGQGNAGNILIDATGDITIDGTISPGVGNAIFSNVEAGAEGNAGSITINADSLNLLNGGQIQTLVRGETDDGTLAGVGNAGDITINVTDTVLIDGIAVTFNGAIFSIVENGATGNAGNINIDSEAIIISNGGGISVDNQGTVLGDNSISENDFGNIFITSDTLTLDDGRITANTTNDANGNITLNVSDYIFLLNGDGTLDDEGGSLALISADSDGDGGNITINTTALVAIPGQDSDITANSTGGEDTQGGRVTVDAEVVLGIQASDNDLPGRNDITAISESGSEGTVTINTPQTNPQQENIEPPEDVTDETDVVSQNACDLGTGSQLANSGRGGLPQIPGFIIRNDTVNVDLVDEVLPAPPPEAIKPHHRTDVTFLDSNGEEFKPAMGAVLLPNGMVEFVDYNPAEVYRDMYAAAGCSG